MVDNLRLTKPHRSNSVDAIWSDERSNRNEIPSGWHFYQHENMCYRDINMYHRTNMKIVENLESWTWIAKCLRNPNPNWILCESVTNATCDKDLYGPRIARNCISTRQIESSVVNHTIDVTWSLLLCCYAKQKQQRMLRSIHLQAINDTEYSAEINSYAIRSSSISIRGGTHTQVICVRFPLLVKRTKRNYRITSK